MAGGRRKRAAIVGVLAVMSGFSALASTPAHATPVCTDGFMGGPPLAACGDRIFPEASMARAYVQFTDNPLGFNEFRHGIEFLSQKYSRYVDVTTLREHFNDPDAVSPGADGKRSTDPTDAGDGRDIRVVKVTDETVPDDQKKPLFFSLAVHGNERGGLEGGLRTAEDLAMGATTGVKIPDGVDNYESTTGRKPTFNEYTVAELLKNQVIYFVDFNSDGWAVGDLWAEEPGVYGRGNAIGTDLNRQMETVGSINTSRNPLEESEMKFGTDYIEEIAAGAPGGKLAFGGDIHGELASQAYMDIMYPAGQFDSVQHRRLMAIAERTKSVIDATLFEGIVDEIEDADGGNEAEGSGKDTTTGLASIPTKPAHWATVWDTLGYTDTGFIGDYLATEVAVTGMDYEIFLNHTVPMNVWNVFLQENHINASRGIIKTAMAYAMTQEKEFSDDNVVVDPGGRAGYVANPDTVTDTDENGPGTLPGPTKNGVGRNGKPVMQASYEVSNTQWFEDTNRLMPKKFKKLASGDIARDASALNAVDTLVLADVLVPQDPEGRTVDEAAYWANLGAWVRGGGNLVLTDRALHALEELAVVPKGKVTDVKVYQPYANLRDLAHPLAKGLRSNARQLVEAPALGYGIGNSASPMSLVEKAAFEAAGGRTVATTGNNTGTSDGQTTTSVGELALGTGKVRIVGGALPMPTETLDHRFGLRDYAMTYTGLFLMENALKHDSAALGGGECSSRALRGKSRRAKVSRKACARKRAAKRAGVRR